ncbi:E3 ubiquitin-protein ligase BRE1 isoform X2 [Monomorium pharaonis]|uniref:E3 ubiquitin-protein ligase BRE1 isoform X2 n=1 Tax=Monomorium pharaonis TaxID=307658 RepID=UPI001747B25F|nr:E3 ubiquitin-protein ligase BRE1 isoform X2 [Monomorium pharaonis]
MNRLGKVEYLALQQPENTVWKPLSQPVRIPQLLGSSGQLHSGQKITDIDTKLPYNGRNVRRNLKFTEIPISTMKTKRLIRVSMDNINNDPREKKSCSFTRESFLVPPNTIKELYIKNRFKRNKDELCQFRISTMDSDNINTKIPKILENNSSLIESINSNTDSQSSVLNSADAIVRMERNKTLIIPSISSQTLNTNEQSGINILHSPHSDLADTNSDTAKISENLHSNENPNIINICQNRSHNNKLNDATNGSQFFVGDMNAKINADLHNGNDVNQNIYCTDLPDAEKVEEICSINIDKDECLATNIYQEGLHLSLRTVKTLSESCLNSQHDTNDDGHVTLSKTEFTAFASKLEHLVNRLEEDTASLKLILTSINNMLSVPNVASREIKDNNKAEIKQTMEVTKNINDNIKVMDNMDKLSCITIVNINTEHNNVSKKICRTLDVRKSESLKTNVTQLMNQTYVASGASSNKENEDTLNSSMMNQDKESKSGAKRRSARLMKKVLNDLNVSNDSFVKLENELDITMKLNTPIKPLANRTPAKTRYKDKMGRPLQEYMNMKSHLSCLLTPNINRFNSSESKNNVKRDTDNTKTVVSDKLLEELYNLYENSHYQTRKRKMLRKALSFKTFRNLPRSRKSQITSVSL